MNIGGLTGIQNHITEMEEPEEEIGNHHDVSGLGFHHTGQYAEYITVKLSKILLSQ